MGSAKKGDTEKNQMEILELKNIATEVQHQNGRTEEQINELEDKKQKLPNVNNEEKVDWNEKVNRAIGTRETKI